MKGLSRGLILTLVLTLFAAVGGTWIGARYIYAQQHQPSLHEFVHEELKLNADQQTRLAALEQDFARLRLDHAHHGVGQRGLSAPALTDQRQGPPGLQREAHPVDGLQRRGRAPVLHHEPDMQVADLEHGHGGLVHSVLAAGGCTRAQQATWCAAGPATCMEGLWVQAA